MASPNQSTVRSVFFPLAVICTAGMLLASPAANAQRRGMVMVAPAVQTREVVRVAPTIQPTHVRTVAPPMRPVNRGHAQFRPAARLIPERRANGNFVCASGAGLSVQQLIDPTPPYGFNYQYLSAINGDLAEKATIDPATENALNEARRLNCGAVGTGGYVLLGGGGYAVPEEVEQESDESESAPPPQVIVVQTPAAQNPAQPAAAVEEETPLPDQAQFVLVMRDGTQLEAAAFTRAANTIVYITPDGMRRTILLSDLDTNATIRLNGERGTQLQLSL